MPNYIEASKMNWEGNGSTDGHKFPGVDYMNMASLQRIAAATEAMAVNHLRLQSDYERMERDRDRYKDRWVSECNSNRYLKGQITKLKNKIKEMEGQSI